MENFGFLIFILVGLSSTMSSGERLDMHLEIDRHKSVMCLEVPPEHVYLFEEAEGKVAVYGLFGYKQFHNTAVFAMKLIRDKILGLAMEAHKRGVTADIDWSDFLKEEITDIGHLVKGITKKELTISVVIVVGDTATRADTVPVKHSKEPSITIQTIKCSDQRFIVLESGSVLNPIQEAEAHKMLATVAWNKAALSYIQSSEYTGRNMDKPRGAIIIDLKYPHSLQDLFILNGN